MKLIIIIGRHRAGKDTVADIICKYLECNRLCFADQLKQILSTTLNIDIKQLNDYKNNNTEILNTNMRNILINFGETMKQTFDKNIWCNVVKNKLLEQNINIITDMRYLCEYNYFIHYNPIIIKVDKENVKLIPNEKEVDEIPYTFLIKNDNSINDLEVQVLNILKQI